MVDNYGQAQQQPPATAPPAFNPQQPPMQMSSAQQSTTTNEELIEAIIEEKWNDLVKDIAKIVEWKTATESRITKLEQSMKDAKDSFDQLHAAILGKVGEYDKHILDVGTEVKAMEKVFEKVLPMFTENVAALTHIADQFQNVLGGPAPAPQPKKEEIVEHKEQPVRNSHHGPY